MRRLNKKQIKHRFQITDLLVKYVNFSGYLQSLITSLNFTKHQNKQTLTILLSYRANNRIEHNVDMCPVVVDCSKTVNFFTRCCNNGIDLRCIKPLRNICKVVRHRIKLNKSYRNEQGCTLILHKLCHLMLEDVFMELYWENHSIQLYSYRRKEVTRSQMRKMPYSQEI